MAVKQKVKNEFFDEMSADHKVIESLISELRRSKMSVVKTVDGKYYRVDAEQEISEQEVNAEVAKLQSELSVLETLVAPVEPATPAAPETPAAPVDPAAAPATPADQTAPSAPATPEAPVAPAAPTDGTTAPDPNAVNLT